jgi:hypothetical protein
MWQWHLEWGVTGLVMVAVPVLRWVSGWVLPWAVALPPLHWEVQLVAWWGSQVVALRSVWRSEQ